MFGYDLSGRQTSQSDYDAYGYSVVYARAASYDATGKLTGDASATVRSDGTWYAATTYSFVSGGRADAGAVPARRDRAGGDGHLEERLVPAHRADRQHLRLARRARPSGLNSRRRGCPAGIAKGPSAGLGRTACR